MDVLAFRNLPVGILWWESPAKSLSVFVKVTLSVFGDEPEIPAQMPSVCFDEIPAFGTPAELDYASDFVPRKRHVDLLLTGHAYAPSPRPVIASRIALFTGEKRLFEKRFFALAAEPSLAIPLSSSYLRTEPQPSSAPVTVRALSPWSELRARQIGRLPLGVHGGPLIALPPEFDFSVFNAAPPDQRLDVRTADPAQGLTVLLEGLHPKAPQFRFQLPAERPRVYIRTKDAPGLFEIPLACDTLWIQSDLGYCTTVFRGTIVLKPSQEIPTGLVLTFPPYGLQDNLIEINARLSGARRIQAKSFEDLVDSGPESSRPEPEEATNLIQLSTLTGDAVEEIDDFEEIKNEDTSRTADEIELLPELEPEAEIEPEPESEPVPTPRLNANTAESARISKPSITLPVDDETTSAGFIPAAANPLPFVASAPAQHSPAPGPKRITLSTESSRTPPSADLPFLRAPLAAQPPRVHSNELPQTVPLAPAAPLTELDEPTELPSPGANTPPPSNEVPFALPFARNRRKATMVPQEPALNTAPRPVLPFMAQGETLPPPQQPERPASNTALPFIQAQTPAFPTPPADIPKPAHPVLRLPPLQIESKSDQIATAPPAAPAEPNPIELLLPLEQYAAIQMDIWQSEGPIEGLFERHGTSELKWRDDDQRRAQILAEQAKNNRSDLALAMAEALAKEREKKTGKELSDSLSPERYAEVRVELEEAGDIDEVLRARAISDTTWQAVHRMYQKRAAADPGFAAQMRAFIEEARQKNKEPKPAKARPKRKARSRNKETGHKGAQRA